jgi:flagellar protein FlgJ
MTGDVGPATGPGRSSIGRRPAPEAGPGKDPGPAADASRAGGRTDDERLRAATRDFEAVFIQQMLKVMRETVPDGGLLDGGQSEEIFSSLLDEHLAGLSAGEGRGGLADALYRQFVEGAP